MDRASLSHTKWNCIYHIIFIPKYRRKVMFGKLRRSIRENIKKLCGYKEVKIVGGSVSVDHVHLIAKIPPKLSVSKFMGYLKGKATLMIFDEHPEYKNINKGHFWAVGYYVDTVGLDKETIKKYVKEQYEADMIDPD